jgi:hypothetical protein
MAAVPTCACLPAVVNRRTQSTSDKDSCPLISRSSMALRQSGTAFKSGSGAAARRRRSTAADARRSQRLAQELQAWVGVQYSQGIVEASRTAQFFYLARLGGKGWQGAQALTYKLNCSTLRTSGAKVGPVRPARQISRLSTTARKGSTMWFMRLEKLQTREKHRFSRTRPCRRAVSSSRHHLRCTTAQHETIRANQPCLKVWLPDCVPC